MNNIKNSTTPLVDKTKPRTDEFHYIGDDGKLYPTPDSLEEANKIYWETWQKINANGNKQNISHLRALDGSYHSNPESIKEANRRFRELYAEQYDHLKIQRTELLNQLLENPKYALECAGIGFIKQIYQIDPVLTQDILKLMLDTTKTGDFEGLESSFLDFISVQAEKQNESKKR